VGQIVTVYPEQPSHRQTLVLGDTQYSLRLTWRERPAAWYADLWQADGTPVWLGQRVTPGWALGGGLTPAGKPAGALLVRGPSDYGRYDLGDTVQIVFYADDELPAAAAIDDALTVTVP